MNDDPSREFLYVLIPEGLSPLDRGDKCEDTLDDRLGAFGLGEVTGGGSQLGELRHDGTRAIESCGIDIELDDLERGRDKLRKWLLELEAPPGTELHYTVDGVTLKDSLGPDGWELDLPRTQLHPGFGV